jgi:hypothetical protein
MVMVTIESLGGGIVASYMVCGLEGVLLRQANRALRISARVVMTSSSQVGCPAWSRVRIQQFRQRVNPNATTTADHGGVADGQPPCLDELRVRDQLSGVTVRCLEMTAGLRSNGSTDAGT